MEDKEKADNIRSVTLRVAIFFGLTTFTLCIGIFYIESILDDTQELVHKKNNMIDSLEVELQSQVELIRVNEHEINVLQDQLEEMQDIETFDSEE